MALILSKLFKDEKGAALIEDGLMLVVIMTVRAAAVALIGARTKELFTFSW